MNETAGWDEQALREISASAYTEGVLLTDGKGNVLLAELKEPRPEAAGPLLDLALGSQVAVGRRLGLGTLRVSACLYDAGAIVWGRTERHALVILASRAASLGYLLQAVRRVFPHETLL